MDDLLNNKVLPILLTTEEYKKRIKDLHPVANENNILPDKSLDPPLNTAARCTALETQDIIYSLSRNSSNGGKGATNVFIMGVFDDRKEPGFDIESGPTDQYLP